jgi:TRAP-type transport system small permease protein
VGEPGVLRWTRRARWTQLLDVVRWAAPAPARGGRMNAPDRHGHPAARGHDGRLPGADGLLVFVNVVLRYGFGSGIAASEELSRLLFVWMVFIGATAAYPAGEHMAFTSLVGLLRRRPAGAGKADTLLIRLLVLLAAVLVGRGAWQQVVVGMGSHSVVLGYPRAAAAAGAAVRHRHRRDGGVGNRSRQAAGPRPRRTWNDE